MTNNVPPVQTRAGEARERTLILVVGGLIAVTMIVLLIISSTSRTNPATSNTNTGVNTSAGVDANADASASADIAFLETNAQEAGVTTTASGLQYEVITEGTGARPTASNTVTVHYTGTLTNGMVFDSSVERGEPATFPLSGVIPGWTEGVQLMTIGSKYRFTIPSDLGYGQRGQGSIPPNATLIFEIELLGIQ